jgi:hypothetical protein
MSTTQATSNAIEIGQLASGEWGKMLEQLALDAEAAGPDASLQDRMDLSLRAISLLWLGWSPPLIARSARASMALREPVVIAPAELLDKAMLSSRAARMQGLTHLEHLPRPTAALAPLILEPEESAPAAAPAPPRRRRRSPSAGDPPSPGWLSVEALAEKLQLSVSAVQRWAREGLIPAEQLTNWRGRYYFAPEVEPPEKQPARKRPAPDGWMASDQVCSLLSIDRAKLARWRREGLFPLGSYKQHGRGYIFDGDLVEAMLNRQQNGDGWAD